MTRWGNRDNNPNPLSQETTLLKCEAVEPAGKTCTNCGVWKPMTKYYNDKAKRDGKASNCTACNTKSTNNARLKRVYGLTRAEWHVRLAAQGSKCGICQRTLNTSAHTDHDHASGVVRALLCCACNRGLGFFRDNPKTLRAAAQYVEVHRGNA